MLSSVFLCCLCPCLFDFITVCVFVSCLIHLLSVFFVFTFSFWVFFFFFFFRELNFFCNLTFFSVFAFLPPHSYLWHICVIQPAQSSQRWHKVWALTLQFGTCLDGSLSVPLLLRRSASRYLCECAGECQPGRSCACKFVSFSRSQVWPPLAQLEWLLMPKNSHDLPVLAV